MLAAGCVERKLTIRSEPEGALVVLDGKNIGRTPCTIRFKHYGTREVLLTRSGCYRKLALAEIKPPVYQRFPLDIFFELFWPATLVDRQTFTYKLRTLGPVDAPRLEKRARELQNKAEFPRMQ